MNADEYLKKESCKEILVINDLVRRWISNEVRNRIPKISSFIHGKKLIDFIIEEIIGMHPSITEERTPMSEKFTRHIQIINGKGKKIFERDFTYDLTKFYKKSS